MSIADDENFMRLAIAKATEQGADPSLSPIGCAIVLHGQVIAVERNQVAQARDVTAHAEIMAMRVAGKNFHNGELREAVLYTTLQPCGMCTMASIWSKVRRIVYGAGREDVHKMYFEARHVDTLNFINEAYRDDLSIEGGILRAECAALYYGPNDHPPKSEQGNI
jgi:tRNA(adenine34) deaminase